MIRKLVAAASLLSTVAAPALAAPPTMKSPRFSIAKATAAADATTITFVISKTNRTSQPSSIGYTTLDGSAVAGTDYVTKSGTLQIPASVTKTYLPIKLIRNPAGVPGVVTKSFGVTLSAGTNAILGTATATGTVTYGATTVPTKTCADGSIIPTTSSCPAPPTPPATQTCLDGSVIPAANICPATPPVQAPIGPAGERPLNLTPGLANIPSDFLISTDLVPAWGTGNIPVSAGPADNVGAFRFICGAGHLKRDDPIVYPNQPGVSHLHQFYGNLGVDANSTYASLRASTAASSCETGSTRAVNQSGYWQPAMLDGVGNVVRPDYISVYYKRRPISDPKCSLTSGDPQAEGNCVPLPNGLRFIFGYDMLTGKAPTGGFAFNCDGPTAVPGYYATLGEAAAHCPTAPTQVKQWDGSFKAVYNRLGTIVHAPSCWNGTQLDSANHRDHVAYGNYDAGYYKCPVTHPYVIPAFSLGSWFTVDANLGTWRFSSDEMHPELAAGLTFHADWFGAWDNQVHIMWMENCINKLLNCSGGDLGNGKQIAGAAGPPGWEAVPRLVPLSSIP